MKRRRMMKKLLILSVILSLCGASQAIFVDNFDHVTVDATNWDRINYQGWYEGGPGNAAGWSIGGWDGYQSLPDPGTGWMATMAAYNHVETFNWGQGEYSTDPLAPNYDPDKVMLLPGTPGTANGVLRMISSGSAWDGSASGNTGPYLYKNWSGELDGDFEAIIEVVGQNHVWNNLGGLMARAPNSDAQIANENWVLMDYFPNYGVGNHLRDTRNGVSREEGRIFDTYPTTYHWPGFPCHNWLKLKGDYGANGWTFYFELSYDGINWTEMEGQFRSSHPTQPGEFIKDGLRRPDLPETLQVGIFQANYAPDWIGAMDFDNFSLVPEPATICLLGLGALALIRRKR
jgi:hypothetical protein